MTEKRFTLAYADYDWWAICDKENPTELGISGEDVVELLNELHEEVMDLRRENTKFKLVVREIIENMQKYVDDNQLVYINQSYVDWIKKEVDTTFHSQKKELE